MAINIKRQRVHDLAREAATLTGQSQTDVIERALKRYLSDLQSAGQTSRREQVAALLKMVDADISDDDRAALRAHDLYDDAGLPR